MNIPRNAKGRHLFLLGMQCRPQLLLLQVSSDLLCNDRHAGKCHNTVLIVNSPDYAYIIYVIYSSSNMFSPFPDVTLPVKTVESNGIYFDHCYSVCSIIQAEPKVPDSEGERSLGIR